MNKKCLQSNNYISGLAGGRGVDLEDKQAKYDQLFVGNQRFANLEQAQGMRREFVHILPHSRKCKQAIHHRHICENWTQSVNTG